MVAKVWEAPVRLQLWDWLIDYGTSMLQLL